MSAPVMVGFFGKLPARGDFIRAGLSRGFIDTWDTWLQQVLPPCRQILGADWDDIWSVSLAWRFALPGRALGLLLPSVDRAARQFPLTIAAEGADDGDIFLDAAEQAARDALDQEFAPDMLFARLQDIPPPAAAPTPSDAATRWWTGPGRPAAEDVLSFDGLPDAAALARMLAR
jgi:type VI secretion system protein ImpM